VTDVIDEIEAFILKGEPRKLAKLQSTIQYRRFQLTLLKEILLELRKISQQLEEIQAKMNSK